MSVVLNVFSLCIMSKYLLTRRRCVQFMSSGKFQSSWKCSFQPQKTCWARKTMVRVNVSQNAVTSFSGSMLALQKCRPRPLSFYWRCFALNSWADHVLLDVSFAEEIVINDSVKSSADSLSPQRYDGQRVLATTLKEAELVCDIVCQSNIHSIKKMCLLLYTISFHSCKIWSCFIIMCFAVFLGMIKYKTHGGIHKTPINNNSKPLLF